MGTEKGHDGGYPLAPCLDASTLLP